MPLAYSVDGMHVSTPTLLWMFPIAFMLHDFEELLFWEIWLSRNREEILARIPPLLADHARAITGKNAARTAFPIALLFALTAAATFAAVEGGSYPAFLLAAGIFFVHAFMHLGQALVLRRYVPAVLTSISVIIPYGLALFSRLLADGVVTRTGLCVYLVASVPLVVPLILLSHKAGDCLFRNLVERHAPPDVAGGRRRVG